MKHLRFQRGAMILMALLFMCWVCLPVTSAFAEEPKEATKTNAQQYSSVKSKYKGYSDSEYFKQMVKVYYPDVSSLDSTSWAWAIAGTLIAFLSIVGFLFWIIAVLVHIYRSLRAHVSFGDTRFWKTAIMYLFLILLSFSGGLGTVVISWYSFVHESGGAS